MDDDDFGDLYDSELPIVAHKTLYDDDDDVASISSLPRHPVYLSKPLDAFSLDRAPNLADPDADEDEDDMLLLGYNGNSGLALCSVEDSLGERNCKVPTLMTTKHHDIPATEIDNLGEGYPELTESERVEGVTANGVMSAGSMADKVGYAQASKEGFQSVIVNSLDDPERSPDIGDLTNRTVSIPGLSTTVTVAPFEIEDSTHAVEDNWEEEEARKELLDPAAEEAEDWDSDSQDDLQIVLNNDRSMYASGEKARVSRFEGDSEDEDEEDLIIVAGGEFGDEQEWGEEQPLLPEAQAVPADGSIALEGDKQGDEKGLQEKTGQGVAASQSVSRSGHGFHNHPSAFKYVRPGAAPFYGGLRAPAPINRAKGASGIGDWRGSGRGSYGSLTAPQLPSWGASGPPGTKSGYEFALPPSKTVFDIDLEFFDEKPWRHPAVDATDYFNFGFNENTWKDYCKQLAQLRLGSTMQSKIRVYESGRSEQEYDPDLPRELVAAAGLHEAGERNRHHQIEPEAGAAAMGRGRFHTHMIPTGRPIQVESGLGDRRPSADLRRQRLRDSDAIILLEPMADEEKQGKRDEDAVNKEEEDDDGEDEEEEEEVRNIFKPRPQQLLWHEDRGPSERKNIHQGASFLPLENFKKGGGRRLSCGSDSDEITTFSTDHVMQPGRQVGKKSVSTGFGLFSGQAVNHPHRDMISSPPTPPGMVVEERTDLDFNRSHSSGLCQDNPKDLKDDESFVPRQIVTGEKLQSAEGSHADDLITAENCQNKNSELSGQELNDSRRYISREAVIHDTVPEELQPNSPGFSPMRQRLASPEGSQTASRDDFDIQKSSKSIVLMKESADSGESARHGWEDAMNSSHARENKRHRGLSKENKSRDSREASEIHHKKQAFTYIRHDAESETDSHGRKVHEPRKIAVELSIDKATLKEPSRQWPEREKSMYIQKKEREEELRKRVYLGKDGAHYTERAGNRSDSRRRDDGLRRDRRDTRKRDDEDRRDRVDKGFRQREREVESSNRHNAEKDTIKRKREEEYRRKDRSEKEEDGRSHSQKEKEKHGLERHDRHVDLHLRRKEEESWKRDRLEEHHRLKARDGSWRDRKETQYRNGVYRDVHGGTRKDDERIGQIGRSRRHDEDRSWHGRDESRKNEVARAAEPRDYSREKRKRSEEFGKDKSRSFEGRAKPGSDREDLHLSENVVLEDDRLLRERATGKHSKCSDEQRTSGWRLHSDKHKSEGKRNRDLDSHMNESASRLGEFSDSSKRKKTANGKNETVSRKHSDNPVSVDIGVNHAGDEPLSDHLARTEYHSSHPEKRFTNELTLQVAKTGPSENEEHKSKGRSKLERWTSHKDLVFGASERAPSQDKLKMKDQRLMTGEKHRHNSLDFHSVRMNSHFDHEDQQMSETHMKPGEVCLSPERANGCLTQVGEKRESVGQNDRDVSNVDEKSSRGHPEQRHPAVPRMDIATKLERRKERFKASMEDRDLAKMLDGEDYQQIDKDEAMQERPARKRRWTSG